MKLASATAKPIRRRQLISAALLTVVTVAGQLWPSASFAAVASLSRVSPHGVGPIVIGTNRAQAEATGTRFAATTPVRGSTCYYLTPAGSDGLRFLVESGTLRRSEVRTPAIATVDGFRVGEPIARAIAFYGTRAHVSAGKYDPTARTVTIDPPTSADRIFRTVFHARSSAIDLIVSGALPQVAYVEGCS